MIGSLAIRTPPSTGSIIRHKGGYAVQKGRRSAGRGIFASAVHSVWNFQLLRARLNVAIGLVLVFPRGGTQIVGALQVESKLRIYAEIAAKAQGCVCGDRTLAIDDLRGTVRRHAHRHRQLPCVTFSPRSAESDGQR